MMSRSMRRPKNARIATAASTQPRGVRGSSCSGHPPGCSPRVRSAHAGRVRASGAHNHPSVSSLGIHKRPTVRAISYADSPLYSSGSNGASSNGYYGSSASSMSSSDADVVPSSMVRSVSSAELGGPLKIFSGTSNEPLAEEVASYLGMELGKIDIKSFADGETYVQLKESIRGCDVFLLQSTCPPTNETLMELFIMIDACKRASARNITAVIPYFGYSRADRKASGRESITAKLVANLLTEAGADRVLALDIHSLQCIGYFDIPVDHVFGQPVLLDYLASKGLASDEMVVVSPDVGGVARARNFAKLLNDAPLAIIDKRRSAHNVAEVMNVIGDVEGKVCIMVDDMIDTAGTITKGAEVLQKEGAKGVIACATHAVFSGPAVERLSSGFFQEVVVTNSMPVSPERSFPQLTVLSVANLLGETIWRIHNSSSVESFRAAL